jgi:Ni2+-binding GTPase involved in maturation of urease and hydrogenase
MAWFRKLTSARKAVRPSMPVFKLSAKTGDGMEEYLEFLDTRLSKLRSQTTKT